MEKVTYVRHREINGFLESNCTTKYGCYTMTAVRWYYADAEDNDHIWLDVKVEREQPEGNPLNDYRPYIRWDIQEKKFLIHQNWMGEVTAAEMEKRVHLMNEAIKAVRCFESVDLNKTLIIAEK